MAKKQASTETTTDRDTKAVLALTRNGRPKSYLRRLTEKERDDLASIWDRAAPPHGDFNRLMGEFWQARLERLDAEKTTDDITDSTAASEPE